MPGQGLLHVFRIANGVPAHIVVEVDVDVEAAFQPRADLRHILIQVSLSIIPAISFAVVPPYIHKVGGYRLSDVHVSPVSEAERDVVLPKVVENRRNQPCRIPYFNDPPPVFTGTMLFQSSKKGVKAIEIDLELRWQLKKDRA